MNIGDAVLVVGPAGSLQLGQRGRIVSISRFADVYPPIVTKPGRKTMRLRDPETVVATVQLDGEDKLRNFFTADLQGAC